MTTAATVAGYVWLTIVGVLALLCVAAITVVSIREARADRQARRSQHTAHVLRLPLQSTNCRVVDLSDRRPSA